MSLNLRNDFMNHAFKTYALSSALFFAVGYSSLAFAQTKAGIINQTSPISANGFENNSAAFDVFKPRPQSRKTKLDYALWDEALNKVVLDFGPSTRRRARKPTSQIGTRFVRGHKSAYRLEGTRFTFEFISDDYLAGLTEYRKDLEDIATRYNITTFSKDEQLAFWINLHNVAVIEKIAQNYPTQRPDYINIKIGETKYDLDNAPFINVLGKAISPSDIRNHIVYPNWTDPNVIYGFARGEIGSPSLQRYAYTSENIEYMLKENADDFVNSLRGFNLGSSTKNVSEIYNEAAPFYFRNWEQDLQNHLLLHANEKVTAELQSQNPFKLDTYDNMVADLSGGRRLGASGSPSNTGFAPEISRMLGEVTEKKRYLRRQGILQNPSGYVIIEDLIPEDE